MFCLSVIGKQGSRKLKSTRKSSTPSFRKTFYSSQAATEKAATTPENPIDALLPKEYRQSIQTSPNNTPADIERILATYIKKTGRKPTPPAELNSAEKVADWLREQKIFHYDQREAPKHLETLHKKGITPQTLQKAFELIGKDSLVEKREHEEKRDFLKEKLELKSSWDNPKFMETDPSLITSQLKHWFIPANTAPFTVPPADFLEPIKVAVTGASGNIAYALLFRIASGEMFGAGRRVDLRLIDLDNAIGKVEGVKMELADCAFPAISDIKVTSKYDEGFEDADWVLCVGSKPRTKGMERGDLLKDNGKIFKEVGESLNRSAGPKCRVVVVGNPANTNALILQSNAPKLDPFNFSALTRLDHNRGLSLIRAKYNLSIHQEIEKFCIWGNHSATQYPDLTHVVVDGSPLKFDDQWNVKDFIPRVQKRGAEIISARGASSAASAAAAVVDHVRDWTYGVPGNDWRSAAIISGGEYGVTEGLFFSYPVVHNASRDIPSIVEDVSLSSYSNEQLNKTHDELLAERDAVKDLL